MAGGSGARAVAMTISSSSHEPRSLSPSPLPPLPLPLYYRSITADAAAPTTGAASCYSTSSRGAGAADRVVVGAANIDGGRDGPSLPLFLKKKGAKGASCAVPCLPLFRFVSYIPLYRLPLPAPFTAPSGGPPCAAAFARPSFCFRPDARGAGQTHLATDSGPAETHASAPCTAPLAGFRR
jgi:hypothetical protein